MATIDVHKNGKVFYQTPDPKSHIPEQAITAVRYSKAIGLHQEDNTILITPSKRNINRLARILRQLIKEYEEDQQP